MARTLDVGFEAIETPNESNDPYCGHLKMTWKRQTRRATMTSRQVSKHMWTWRFGHWKSVRPCLYIPCSSCIEETLKPLLIGLNTTESPHSLCLGH